MERHAVAGCDLKRQKSCPKLEVSLWPFGASVCVCLHTFYNTLGLHAYF